MPRRVIMRIEITPHAKAKLAETCERNGMTQVSVMSRMVEWFTDQTDLIQAAVLRQYPPEIESDVARLILRKMSNAEHRRDGDLAARDGRDGKERPEAKVDGQRR